MNWMVTRLTKLIAGTAGAGLLAGGILLTAPEVKADPRGIRLQLLLCIRGAITRKAWRVVEILLPEGGMSFLNFAASMPKNEYIFARALGRY
jgi:hypothetical protein